MATFEVLKNVAREAVKTALISSGHYVVVPWPNNLSGATALVVDPALLASLAVVADMPFLTSLGIKQVFYANNVVESDASSLAYIIGD